MSPEKLNIRYMFHITGYRPYDMLYRLYNKSSLGKCMTCEYLPTCHYTSILNIWKVETICMRYKPSGFISQECVCVTVTDSYPLKEYLKFRCGEIYD